MSQCQLILDHLIDHGYITQLVAGNYGIRRLASRITDLQDEGLDIKKIRKKDAVGRQYVEYQLSAEDQVRERARKADGHGWRSAFK